MVETRLPVLGAGKSDVAFGGLGLLASSVPARGAGNSFSVAVRGYFIDFIKCGGEIQHVVAEPGYSGGLALARASH